MIAGGAGTLLALGLLGFAGALAARADLAWIFSLALGLSIFAGNWSELAVTQLSIGLDRVVLFIAFVAFVVRRTSTARGSRLEPAHWLLLLAAVYAVVSAIWVGTLTEREGMFHLLDTFGLVPFAMFVAAPHVFASERQLRILLWMLTSVGAYLSVTALFETVRLNAFIFPQYIVDPDVGIHFGRARGPFAEAVANGLAIFACGVAAIILASMSRRLAVRMTCIAVVGAASSALVMTLTRAIWLGSVVAILVALLAVRRLRPYAFVAIPFLVAVVFVTVSVVPELGTRAAERQAAQAPIWDRINTTNAAFRMLDERPLLGFGWDRFTEESEPYLRQKDDIPLTGRDTDLHNVFLARAVELGVLGGALWLAAFVMAVVLPAFASASRALEPWRIGLLAITIQWIVAASLGPLPYVFANLLLWTWAGLVYPHRRACLAEARRPLADRRWEVGYST
ncbi:MAG: O-antigen ligase family protein [Actinobacteria bacterium]|nr:O-antigen ligase family protein [Actinomycetota bacterium]